MESELGELLDTWAKTFAASEGLPLHVPGRPFSPPVSGRDEAYLEIATLDTDPNTRGMCNGWSIYIWLFQVSIYVRDGLGEGRTKGILDRLRASLHPPMRLTSENHTFTVFGAARAASSVPGDGWSFVPVTIPIKAVN